MAKPSRNDPASDKPAHETDAERTIEELAAYLYSTMEHLDPGPDYVFVTWRNLEDGPKRIWIATINALLDRDDLILRAMKYTKRRSKSPAHGGA